MVQNIFLGQERVTARAYLLGQRIDTRALEQTERLATSPLMVSAGTQGCAVIFRYGVVVLYGLDSLTEANFIENIMRLVSQGVEPVSPESVVLSCDPSLNEGIYKGGINLHEFTVERLQLVADVLAKSEVLSYYETTVAGSVDRIDPLAEHLMRKGRGGSHARLLLQHLGETLSIQGKMVGRVEVAEKPELLWEHPSLEGLYLRLEDEYELRERHLALERKLELISRTAQTLLELLQNKRTLRVEWYIVILIVVEILLTLYEMWGA